LRREVQPQADKFVHLDSEFVVERLQARHPSPICGSLDMMQVLFEEQHQYASFGFERHFSNQQLPAARAQVQR